MSASNVVSTRTTSASPVMNEVSPRGRFGRIGESLRFVLTYDFCPQFNKWLYWIKNPLASLTLAGIAALACAVFVKPIALVAFAAIVLVIVLGYVWPTVAVRGLKCQLSFAQSRVSEREPVTVRVRIANRWPWPVWGIALEGGLSEDDAGAPSRGCSVALARVSGWSSTEFEWTFAPSHRGEYPLATPQLTTGFPFGLRRAGRPVEVEHTLLVWPEIVQLDTLLDAAETRPSEDICSDHRSGESGDMTGTRPFRDGDSLRRVHWAQTARHGRLIVCERQVPALSAVRVVFDSDPNVHRGSGRDGTLEWSIRIAASICAAYHRQNASVECCFGHEVRRVENGTRGLKRFLDELSRWKPCSETTHHSASHSHTTPADAEHHSASCQHEHTKHECRRIHHHNCGVFQVTVTTDIGLAHRTEHRHVHGDQRQIVLRAEAFENRCDLCGEVHAPPSRHAIVLDQPNEVASDFQRKWRNICHAG